MSGRLEITIAGDSNELGPNASTRNPGKKMRLVKKWREKARLLYLNSGAIAFHGRVQVSFIVRRGRRVDADNARSSLAMKACIDGFVDAGMVPDDTTDFVLCGQVKQEIAKEWRDFPELLVIVEPAGDRGGSEWLI